MTESPSETDNKTTSMNYTNGQTITVMRGRTRGKTAEIVGVDAANHQYAVKYVDGTYGVLNAVNVKAPTEDTIGEAKLAAEISTALRDAQSGQGDLGGDATGVLQALVSRLSSDLPGLGARVSWPAEPADK